MKEKETQFTFVGIRIVGIIVVVHVNRVTVGDGLVDGGIVHLVDGDDHQLDTHSLVDYFHEALTVGG